MPGCAAVGCNNRSEKGFIMKCFPRDPKLRKIWQERVARADWEPSNNSFLCHVHFEPEEWSIMPNGRIRLRKNAIPSIFTVTSTRKSPKKRIKLANFKNQTECENDYTMEYLENDTEHSSIGLLEEKDSDSQDIDNPSVKSFVYQQINHSPKTTENKQVSYRQYKNITSNLQPESIILISDDDVDMENNMKQRDSEKQADTERSINNYVTDENLSNNQSEIVIKTEVKQEIDQTSFDSYDEIEEKLKQICDGDREESISNNVEKLNSDSNNQKGVLRKPVTQIPILHRSINYKYSSKDKIGSLLTDDTENIEIIFGSESGEECARVPKCTSYDNNETNEFDKTNQCTANIVNVTGNQEINKSFSEIIEKAQEEKRHVTPNMRAAIKRKRRTREEIMKSIKKSIRNTSSQDTNSISDSDISDNIVEAENEVQKETNTSESTRLKDDTVPTITKFTVKVSGDRENVFDIMQDISKDTKDFTIQECNDVYMYQGNTTFVTSIITIDDSPVETFVKNEHNDDVTLTSITSKDQVSFNLSPLKNDECSNTRLMSPRFDEENNLYVNNSSTLDINSVIEQPTANCITKHEYRKLRQKVKIQEDVIKKLTNQLILYKNFEKNLQNKNLVLEVKTNKMENIMQEFNTKTDSTASSMIYKKNMDLKQKLIDELTNRVNYLEETNKKLMKTVTVENQYKRKLEGEIKQKDNQIKELNWKLEKASKFLDRAEKNTNTYKRKMLSMQTLMRRKKLLDEKMSRFNEMLLDVKDNYTEKAVAMAMEIKEICGSSGYNKLLNFGFPLPSLSALHPSRDNSSDSNKSNNASPPAGPSKHNINEETGTQCANDDTKHGGIKSQILESVGEEIDVTDNTEETIMGTVQDIFEENNDIDDFGTNELREHFILQLNAVM